ncbi:hypothetical protein [Ralstonia sp. UBA689]|uniref:hypothetical protein n=1 Tax=Ralstonia sp. UBA689 TaxID=1947373 RepID=UPI0025E7C207|nr:hypothetical protein [Ralstonia sp. UBA689]
MTNREIEGIMNFLPRGATALLLWTLCATAFAASGPAVKLCEDAACQMPLASEPYQWKSSDGKVLKKGITDDEGNAQVIQAPNVSRYVLETINRHWGYQVEARCWKASFQSCVKLVDAWNIDGFEDNESIEKREAKKAAEEEEQRSLARVRLRMYAQAAASNNDPLAWLGPLPPEWPAEDVLTRWRRLHEQVKNDIETFTSSDKLLSEFHCKTAAEFGDVPDEAAVQQFLTEYTRGNVGEATWDAVMTAAQKGNWQARWFVYAHFKDMLRNRDNLALQYRVLQLKEWLVSHQIGPVYAEFAEALAATGLGSGSGGRKYASLGYFAAAQRGSYTSMAGVGDLLQERASSEEQSVGRAMVACAKANMPKLVN